MVRQVTENLSAALSRTAPLTETVSTNVSGGSFASVIHNQQTPISALLAHNGDHERTRSRRKRTSPGDHAILEAEYQRNPKPDKAARTDIVRRVALNDKEVQVSLVLVAGMLIKAPNWLATRPEIWFQNRRQVTRRGSKPLLPHELYSSFHSSQESPGEHTASSFASSTGNQPDSSGSEITITRSSGNLSSQSDPVVTISAAQSRPSSTPPLSGSDEHSFSGDPDNEANMLHSQRNLESECEAWPAERMEVCVETMMAQKTISSHPAGLNHGIQTTIPNGSATAASSAPLRPLRGTPSSIRLSMSLDGKAQVVLGSGTTPSPPRQTTMPITSAGRPVSLQRSKSAMALSIHAQGNVGDTIPSWPRRSAPGRSGDVRTWEFYCDSDARNALTVQAEQEQKGSAIGILSLIRSGSSSSNIPSTGIITHNPQLKRVSMKRKNPVEINAPRPKVARTASSVATLQTTDATAQAFGSKTKMVDPKYDSQHAIYQDPSGDSDKENWEPGTQSRNFERQAIRHRPEFETQRAILQENTRMPSHSMSLGNLLNRDNIHPRRRENMMVNKLDSQQDKENIAVDGEVAKFMGQGSLPQPEDELNCVQNLLSLSQGAWR